MAQWKDFVGGPIWWRHKSKMADGRHLGFRFWAIISASIYIFAPHLVQWWKIGSPRGPSAQKSKIFENPRWRTAATLDLKVTCPTFEAMGQIPVFHRTYFLLVLNPHAWVSFFGYARGFNCVRRLLPSVAWHLKIVALKRHQGWASVTIKEGQYSKTAWRPCRSSWSVYSGVNQGRI